MTDKELKKLGRAELLEMLLTQTREVDALKKQVEELTARVDSKKIAITRAGSIAEASLMLNGVFEAAQNAAQQYLENLATLDETREDIERESRERAEAILAEAQKKCEAMESEAKARCDEMLRQAEEQSQACWLDVSQKINRILESQSGLREMLLQVNAHSKVVE